MTQKSKLSLFIIVLALSNVAFVTLLKAQDVSDTFYGNGAGNGTTTGINDSAFGSNGLHNVTTGVSNNRS